MNCGLPTFATNQGGPAEIIVDFGNGFVEVLAATQTPGKSGMNWFQGTADAVRQLTWILEDPKLKNIENILILSGDHLYRMDYMDFVQKHMDSGADISVSCVPVDDSHASEFGLLKIDNRGRIHQFLEKPKEELLKSMQVDTSVLGLSARDVKNSPYIASMGVYLFRTEVLLKLLKWDYPDDNDFGSEIIPKATEEYNVQAYLFNEYWEDIGTIKSFFDANLALTDQEKVGYFFCLQDRALLCRNCDKSIHSTSTHGSAHQRFLLTGVQVALQHHNITNDNTATSMNNDRSNSNSSNYNNNDCIVSNKKQCTNSLMNVER